ncbi:MAG: NADPH:quinone oxidoreductase family protein [Rhodobacteraceae bacterium]|nr:NADPH:quinone oxidoreductase family protein [Paracoccaceae bacterium]
MRAMRLHELGGDLKLDEAPSPEPGPGQARLRVLACGINFADTLIVSGKYQEKPELPFSPGMEVCGVVDALGPGVTGGEGAPEIGARVMATTGYGWLAESVLAPAAACVPAPPRLSDLEAAAVPVAYGTSHIALDRRARLQAGERLLVLGAAGGVGLTAVEIGKLMGAEVIACARGAEKLAVAKSKGADHVIDAAEGPDVLRERVKALGGADVVFDPVGGAFWTAAVRSANPEARLLPIGFASGEIPQIPANILLVKNLTAIGLYWGAYAKFAPEALGESFRALCGWLQSGDLTPHVSHHLPLEQATQALELLRQRKASGKVVVAVGASA